MSKNAEHMTRIPTQYFAILFDCFVRDAGFAIFDSGQVALGQLPTCLTGSMGSHIVFAPSSRTHGKGDVCSVAVFRIESKKRLLTFIEFGSFYCLRVKGDVAIRRGYGERVLI